MKVQQENLPFRPVTIKLEKWHEAKALFDLIDKIESFRCNADHGITQDSFTLDEVEIIRKLSDVRTNQEVII